MLRKLIRKRQSGHSRIPVNARITRPDGSTLPLELYYVGRKGKIDCWQATAPFAYRRGDQLSVDVLPARCEIQIAYLVVDQ
jgi:hypothetical protein